MTNLKDYFNKIDNISHAFLIGNVVFDEIKNDLVDIISSKILNKKIINLKNDNDIYFLDQNESLITKEKVKELLNNLSKTSQISNGKVYIVNGAEKMTDTVYNAILKTLEEPQNNIYAILITKNIEMIKDTIKSRCQKIYLNSSNEEIFDKNIESVTDTLIKEIEINNVKSIAYNNKLYNIIEDRVMFQNVLKIMLNKYNNALKNMLENNNIEENSEIIKNNDIISMSKKILVIDNFVNLLNSYLNKNLTLDRFIIEMWRCRI